MPNKNYQKGRRKEYKICKELKQQGWDIVQRTAGSHSPIDIIAINKLQKKILFIQSKPNDWSYKLISNFIKKYTWLNDQFSCDFLLK
jgi:Holliday junction resolvase